MAKAKATKGGKPKPPATPVKANAAAQRGGKPPAKGTSKPTKGQTARGRGKPAAKPTKGTSGGAPRAVKPQPPVTPPAVPQPAYVIVPPTGNPAPVPTAGDPQAIKDLFDGLHKPRAGEQSPDPTPVRYVVVPPAGQTSVPRPAATTTTTARGRKGQRMWFVLAVEPGTDRRVRKEILKRRAINDLEDAIGRVLLPSASKVVTIDRTWKTVHEGGVCSQAREARIQATREAWRIHDGAPSNWHAGADLPDEDPPGYKVVVHPTKGVEKGKTGNSWTWKIQEEVPGAKQVTAKELKYPGYLIINMHMADDTHVQVMKCKGAWGFLPLPIPTGPKGKIVMVGQQPTALDTEEAAELLVAQAAENKKAKDRSVALSIKPGDAVTIKEGPFHQMAGKVVEVCGADRDSTVRVEVTLLGRGVPVSVQLWQLTQEM